MLKNLSTLTLKAYTIPIIFNSNRIMSKKHVACGGSSGAVYGFGFIGAAIYYISTATSFWAGLLGLLKAIVWPGFLVFELMKFLGA